MQINTDGYSREELQHAVDAYSDSFRESVPLGLLTAAAREFRSSELMSILLDRVNANRPIENWDRFSDGFLSRQT